METTDARDRVREAVEGQGLVADEPETALAEHRHVLGEPVGVEPGLPAGPDAQQVEQNPDVPLQDRPPLPCGLVMDPEHGLHLFRGHLRPGGWNHDLLAGLREVQPGHCAEKYLFRRSPFGMRSNLLAGFSSCISSVISSRMSASWPSIPSTKASISSFRATRDERFP